MNGLDAAADAADIASAIRTGLPEGTQMLGVSPEAIAVAIRRSLSRATDWRDYDWEIIHDGPVSPNMHLALDQVLTEEVGAGRRGPTLRFWEWEQPAVVIGSFQSLRNEVDPENAEKYGFEVVRRISGGGAMFMDAGSVVTYSLYAPGDLVQGMSFADSYAYLDEWVIAGLRSLGIDAFYQPLNDITSAKVVEVLRIGREKMSDKGTTSAAKRVDPLRSQTGLLRAEIIERLKQTFTGLYGAREGHVTDAELAEAEELVRTKFATPEWLARVP